MSRIVVVAAALIDDGPPPRVLAARRAYPAELAGRWELPGGKVDPGESETDALVRECAEELGVAIEIGERLGSDLTTVDGAMLLRVWCARIVDGATPIAHEHAELRWLDADQLDSVSWLPADRPVVELLRVRLAGATT